MKLESLFTRPHAQEAKPMQITLVDGSATGKFIQVLGSECKEFAAARREFERGRLKPDSDEMDVSEFAYAKLVSSLVVGWDLDEPCTEENKVKLFYNAPHLAAKVDRFAQIQGNKSAEALNEAKQDSSTGQEEASS